MIGLLLLSHLAANAADVVTTDDGRSVREIRWARAFLLERAEPYRMTAEDPSITDGLLFELRVDPAMVVPVQTDVPVLYVGAVPARTVNFDPYGGCLVGFVPGAPDLATTPIYFGSTELPERVDAARGAEELAAARAVGVRPLPADMVRKALAEGGPALAASDIGVVFAEAATRVTACAPQESERVRRLRGL
jgi:hypothetical protein